MQEIQSAELLADMQAFKAANPGCMMEDFVRWHSPKDWSPLPSTSAARSVSVSSEQDARQECGRGALSLRMRDPENLWQRLWRSAVPVPADCQVPLFDHQSTAEQVKHCNLVLSMMASRITVVLDLGVYL